ncbi:unnamed protein product [Prunus armeniaca]
MLLRRSVPLTPTILILIEARIGHMPPPKESSSRLAEQPNLCHSIVAMQSATSSFVAPLNFPCLRQKLEHIMNSEHEIGRTYVGPKFVSVGSTTAKVELQHFFTMNLEPPLSHPSEAVPEDPIPQANMVDPHATLVDQATVINNVYELTSTIPLNGETKLEPILLLTLEAPIRPLASGIGHGVVAKLGSSGSKHSSQHSSTWQGWDMQRAAQIYKQSAASLKFRMWLIAGVSAGGYMSVAACSKEWERFLRSKNQLHDQMGCKVAARVG